MCGGPGAAPKSVGNGLAHAAAVGFPVVPGKSHRGVGRKSTGDATARFIAARKK